MEGEHKNAAHNTVLGSVQLSPLSALPKGCLRIEVSLDVDANGVLHRASSLSRSLRSRTASKPQARRQSMGLTPTGHRRRLSPLPAHLT
ncbi:Hsp70 family protein [Streptomyces sp. 8N616]|uniref:Hsp70 family protein n=1 Tax=Streptomyces sp. 8N616 TaxID=3457414 RepID=UPI003FD10D97